MRTLPLAGLDEHVQYSSVSLVAVLICRAGADEGAKKDPISECIGNAFSVVDFEILAQASFALFADYAAYQSSLLAVSRPSPDRCAMMSECVLALLHRQTGREGAMAQPPL